MCGCGPCCERRWLLVWQIMIMLMIGRTLPLLLWRASLKMGIKAVMPKTDSDGVRVDCFD